jgi:PAS domain S-box-containing protein
MLFFSNIGYIRNMNILRSTRRWLHGKLPKPSLTDPPGRDAELRYRLIVDTASEGIWAFNADYETTFANARMAEMLGNRQEDLVGRPFVDFVYDEDREDHGKREATRRAGKPEVYERRIRKADGAALWVLISATPTFDDTGRFSGSFSMMTDITYRKHLEEVARNSMEDLERANALLEAKVEERTRELAQRESFLSIIFESLPTTIFVKDARTLRYLRFNRAGEKLTGWSRESVLGKTSADLFPDRDESETIGRDRMVAETKTMMDIPLEIVATAHLGPRMLHTTSIPILDEEGESQYILGIAEDITERKRDEDDLKKLSIAVTQSPAAVVITDASGTIEYVNPKFTELTGYTSDETIGKNPRILNSRLLPPEYFESLWETIRAREVWHGEFLNRRKDGTLYWELASISSVLGDDDEITHYVAVKEDISDKKRVEFELKESKEAAEASNRAKSAFLANMSHEIRTPLNAMLGFSQILLRDESLKFSQRESLEAIERSGKRLLELITEILELSKIEAGRMTFNPSRVDLHSLVDEIYALFGAQTLMKSLELSLDFDESSPTLILTDEAKLRRALINIIGNAVKFTDRGFVRLEIRSARREDGRFDFTFTVVDSGPGIAAEDLPLLFQAFEQTAAGKKSGSGTGLGLALSRDYSRLMGGDILVRSEPGKGSVFSLMIVAAGIEDDSRSGRDRPSFGQVPRTGEKPVRVAELPRDRLEAMREATLTADIDRLLALIAETERTVPVTGAALRKLAAEYRYAELIDLFDYGRSHDL